MKVKTPITYSCAGCKKQLAKQGKTQPFIGLRKGCVLQTDPHQAASIKCSCGHTTVFLKASL